MNIEWTLCSERMPPDDSQIIIVKTWTDHVVKLTKYSLEPSIYLYDSNNYSWTEFTQEKWEFLNR